MNWVLDVLFTFIWIYLGLWLIGREVERRVNKVLDERHKKSIEGWRYVGWIADEGIELSE